MTAAPLVLVNDREAIEDHWHEGKWLDATGRFTEGELSEHEAITMAALIVLGIDGMNQLGRRCVLEGMAELVGAKQIPIQIIRDTQKRLACLHRAAEGLLPWSIGMRGFEMS